MALRVELLPTALDELRSLPKKIQGQIWKKINSLELNALPSGSKILNSQLGYRSLRSGDYRILYKFDDKKKLVTISNIGDRKEVYRLIE